MANITTPIFMYIAGHHLPDECYTVICIGKTFRSTLAVSSINIFICHTDRYRIQVRSKSRSVVCYVLGVFFPPSLLPPPLTTLVCTTGNPFSGVGITVNLHRKGLGGSTGFSDLMQDLDFIEVMM